VQLGVAAGKVQRVGLRQRGVLERREEPQRCAQARQQFQVGRVQKGKRGVARNGDAHPVQAA
jgi:hypothetical protein